MCEKRNLKSVRENSFIFHIIYLLNEANKSSNASSTLLSSNRFKLGIVELLASIFIDELCCCFRNIFKWCADLVVVLVDVVIDELVLLSNDLFACSTLLPLSGVIDVFSENNSCLLDDLVDFIDDEDKTLCCDDERCRPCGDLLTPKYAATVRSLCSTSDFLIALSYCFGMDNSVPDLDFCRAPFAGVDVMFSSSSSSSSQTIDLRLSIAFNVCA